MTVSKTNARITGVLFILGTVPIIAAMLLWGQSVSSQDYLSAMAGHQGQVRLYALAVVFMGLACAGIGISLYPVLKRRNEGLAIAAMGFRLMEGTLHVVNAFGIVALLGLSLEFVKAGSPAQSFFQSAGAAIKTVNDWAGSGTATLAWCVGAFIYYAIFFKTRLVPRWLSVWGLAGLTLTLISDFAAMFGALASFSSIQMLLSLPILVQELVLAVWLIVKGFGAPAEANA
jgi:hypothetical protein